MCYWIKKHFILKLLGKSFKKWLLISVLLSLNETKKQLIPLNSSSTTYDTTTLIQDTKKDICKDQFITSFIFYFFIFILFSLYILFY